MAEENPKIKFKVIGVRQGDPENSFLKVADHDLYRDTEITARHVEAIQSLDEALSAAKLQRFPIAISPTPLKDHVKIVEQVTASLAPNFAFSKGNGDLLDRTVSSFLGRFLEEYILGQGIRGRDRKVTWQGAVTQNPYWGTSISGVELFFRDERLPALEAVAVYGVDKKASIHNKEGFAPDVESLDAAVFYFRGDRGVLSLLLEALGRDNSASSTAQEYIKTSARYKDDSDFVYSANPFSFAESEISPDIIFYPHPDEWEHSNQSFYDLNYLNKALAAKKLMKTHFEEITGQKFRVNRSVVMNQIKMEES